MRLGWFATSLVLVGCGRVGFGAGQDADPATAQAFSGLCTFTRATVIENGLTVDDGAGGALAAAVGSGCGSAPTLRTVSQDSPGILDPATDRPLLADDLAIIGGGDGPNRAIAYLLAADTPVIWSGSSVATYTERRTGRVITQGRVRVRDYAVVMVVTEPIGGGRILSASGMVGNGTRAAARWFATQIAPGIGNATDGWAVVEWTNTDADPAPSAGDSYDVIGSGTL